MTDDGTVVKITAFADDTTGYLNDDDSVKEMFRGVMKRQQGHK